MLIKSTMLCLWACSLVSGEITETNGLTSTETLLMHSTIKPTTAPIAVAQPTKPIIINVPPKTSKGDEVSMQSKDSVPASKTKPLYTPETVVTAENLRTGLHVSDAKPVQVTGFITQSGNIFEIQNKDGIGMIESRQSPANENIHVCNYGSVVIYSDLPCEEVTNIQVRDVKTTLKVEKAQSMANNQNTQETSQNNDDDKDDDDKNTNLYQELVLLDEDEFEKPAPVRRPNQNHRRVQQNQNKQRRHNKNRKSSPVNSNQVNRRRTQAQKNRKSENQQENRRRRLQNQQQPTNAQRLQYSSENRIRPIHQRQTRKGNGSNGSRRPNTNRNGSGNHRRSNKRRQNQSKRRQHNTANDRRRFDEYDY